MTVSLTVQSPKLLRTYTISTFAILIGLGSGRCGRRKLSPTHDTEPTAQAIHRRFCRPLPNLLSSWHLSEDLQRVERDMVLQSHMEHVITNIWLPQMKKNMQETWGDIVHKSWIENIANGGWIKH